MTEPGTTWRSEVMGTSGANVALGTWLVASPFLLGYPDADPWWRQAVAGGLIATLAFIRVTWGARMAGLSWVNLVLGLCVFAHGALLADSTSASINQLFIGMLIVVLAGMSAGATGAAPRRRRP